ncbi:hypothetical protein JOF29_001362 [Kribbella aluminosa]|uniref:Uncharacterized protein n=1 Tax=Kribbella aluminosa TaxID=416017 RepID=A0ABS4UF58_9ACTN|nr:hypothetical protein [Kribbella aluminosa]MBP2350279.1 hypothetical protein [Kribbella aluminosa]
MAVEKNERGWPILYAAQDLACDGINRLTDRACIVGQHRGYHRDETGARWLDGEEDDFLPELHT